MTAVRITIAGHTDHGKTSIVHTLTDDVTFGNVAQGPITMDVEPQLVKGFHDADIIRFYDTPSFEHAGDILHELGPHFEIDDVVQLVAERSNFVLDYKVIDQACNRSEIILYIVRLTEQPNDDYKAEFQILLKCAVPVIPLLIFVDVQPNYRDEWLQFLKTNGFRVVAEYDAHRWTMDREEQLWKTVSAHLDDKRQRAVVEAFSAYRLNVERRRDGKAADIITRLLLDMADFRQVERCVPMDDVVTVRERARQSFVEAVRTRERTSHGALLDSYQLNLKPLQAELDSLVCDPSSDNTLVPDLFGPKMHRYFGLGIAAGTIAGTAVGGTIVAFVGGASFGMGLLVGGLIGVFLGAGGGLFKSNRDQKQQSLTIESDPQIWNVVLGRSLALAHDLRERGHANNKKAPNLNSAKSHVPPDANLAQRLKDFAGRFQLQNGKLNDGKPRENQPPLPEAVGGLFHSRPSGGPGFAKAIDELRPVVLDWIKAGRPS